MSRRLVIVVLALAVAVLAGSVAGCGGDLPKDAVAKVGETYIKKADFDQRVAEFAAQYGISAEDNPETYRLVQTDVLGIMVENALAAIHAAELGISVTDADVQTEIDTMVLTWYNGDQTLLEQDLEEANITMDQFRQQYKDYLTSQKVYDEVTKEVTTVPDEDVAAYYEANMDSYYTEESRLVRHILIMPGAKGDEASTTSTTLPSGSTTTTVLTDADWAAALAKANEVYAKLTAGGDWAELAAEYSDDTYTKDSGGELGEVGMGEMVQEFEEAVFSQDADEISQPIRTIYGYHIIQVTEIAEAYQETLEEVKDGITVTLLEEAKYEAWAAWIEEMKAKVGVIYREDLAPTTTLAPAQSTSTTIGQTITTAGAATTTTVEP